MTHVTGGFGLGHKRHLLDVAVLHESAPYEFSYQRSGKHRFGVIPIMRHDRLELVTIAAWPIPCLFYSAKRAVPNDDAAAGMTRRSEAVHNRIHDNVMRGEKLAARGADFDSNAVLWRNQRRPSLAYIRLPSHGEHQPINHFVYHPRLCFVISDRISIVDHVYHRRRGRGRRDLRHP